MQAEEDLSKLSIGELKKRFFWAGATVPAGCVEKSDLVAALKKVLLEAPSPKNPSAAVPKPQNQASPIVQNASPRGKAAPKTTAQLVAALRKAVGITKPSCPPPKPSSEIVAAARRVGGVPATSSSAQISSLYKPLSETAAAQLGEFQLKMAKRLASPGSGPPVVADVLRKTGKELFRELLRIYSTATVEDYYKNGAWLDDVIKSDYVLLTSHRKQAGAVSPPDLEDVVVPEPKPQPIPTPVVAKPSVPTCSIAVTDAPTNEVDFVAHWKLNPLMVKAAIANLSPQRRLYVFQRFKSVNANVSVNEELATFIKACHISGGWDKVAIVGGPTLPNAPGQGAQSAGPLIPGVLASGMKAASPAQVATAKMMAIMSPRPKGSALLATNAEPSIPIAAKLSTPIAATLGSQNAGVRIAPDPALQSLLAPTVKSPFVAPAKGKVSAFNPCKKQRVLPPDEPSASSEGSTRLQASMALRLAAAAAAGTSGP